MNRKNIKLNINLLELILINDYYLLNNTILVCCEMMLRSDRSISILFNSNYKNNFVNDRDLISSCE